jgi:hypothetical protein
LPSISSGAMSSRPQEQANVIDIVLAPISSEKVVLAQFATLKCYTPRDASSTGNQ